MQFVCLFVRVRKTKANVLYSFPSAECQVDPYLESVVEINPDALQLAANLDNERQQGIVRSRLHGIPVLVKDVRYGEGVSEEI
jgi:Asp-tRNA(Asn)/Glu-tRNA(Gln) amidotransferase A subunit family amidase